MENKHTHQGSINKLAMPITLIIGIMAGTIGGFSWAQVNAPAEHKGLNVEQLGFVPAESMVKQVGLDGYKLLLRRITIDPGGQIAKHSAESTPGVVYMDSGEWVEGRDNGETVHAAGDTFIEDSETVHWFFNRGDEPAAAYVCDIKAI